MKKRWTDAFKLCPIIGPVTFQYLLDSFNQNPSEILSANEAELLKVNGVGKIVSEQLDKRFLLDGLKKKKKNLLKWAVFFSSEIKSLSTLSS